MKKGIKITLISLGAVVLTAAALYGTLGGLPVKRQIEKEYGETINYTASEFPYAALEASPDYAACEAAGIRFMMPADVRAVDDSDPENNKARSFRNDGKTVSIYVALPEDMGELPFDDPAEKKAKKLMDDFCRSLGYEPLKNWHDMYNMLFHVTLDDCSIHSAKNAAIFKKLAEMKDEIPFMNWDCWDWQSASGETGFLRMLEYYPEEGSEPQYKVMAECFDKENGNIVYDLFINAPDPETCCRIANSVCITPEAAAQAKS